MTFDELTNRIRACKACFLHRGRNRVVISRGSPQATIMLVGEGPGQQEDEDGIPFVGQSGNFLDKMLKTVGLDVEEDIYICNVVKCRAPGNRDPILKEIEACRGFLEEQLALVNPVFVVTLGKVPMHFFLGTEEVRISDVRGEVYQLSEGRVLLPLFHPAYLLRSPSNMFGTPKWKTWQDLKDLVRRWRLYGRGEKDAALEITNDLWP